jgi:hypothetical protein
MSDLLECSPFDPAVERKIVIIADWLPPDFGAVGQYMQMRAKAFAAKGHDVTLVGLSSKAHSVRRESIGSGSLTEIRLAARPVPRGSLVKRVLWTLWTNLRLVTGAFVSLRAAHGILFTGSPPFLIHFLMPLKWLWKGRLIYRITDFHPECLIAAERRPSRPLEAVLALTNMWRRRVDGFEVLGEDQLLRLLDTGIPQSRITLVRDGSPVSFTAGQAAAPLPPELAGHCVLLYSGNYGVAHEVETVFEGYRLHHQKGSGRVRLWLSAAGSGTEELMRRCAAASLPLHRSAPVPIEFLPALLMSPDAHLVTLKDSFVGFVMPSKIYGCIDSGRPIIFVGSASSDVDLLVKRAKAPYWRVNCGDSAGFAASLEDLAKKTVKSPCSSHA